MREMVIKLLGVVSRLLRVVLTTAPRLACLASDLGGALFDPIYSLIKVLRNLLDLRCLLT